MNWQIWIVPVIALAVWILLQMRAPDAPPQQPRQRPPEGDRPRQPSGDVGRFLEEIERLRRQAAPERRERPPMVEAAPVESTGPAAFERPSPPPPRVEKPKKVKKPRPVPVTVVAPAAALPILDVLPVDPPRPHVAPTVAAPQKPRRIAPAAAQLTSLLQTPGSLQTAILLQEVLGPPRCRRKR
jgi:hypothetical protein